jgi:hypothetical protein
MKRAGQPAELSAPTLMLADPLSSYTSGTTVAVTGGKPSFATAGSREVRLKTSSRPVMRRQSAPLSFNGSGDGADDPRCLREPCAAQRRGDLRAHQNNL